jgi:hypothetical protein
MFPNHTTQSLATWKRFWLLPVVALAMVLALSAMFAFSTASAQTPAGDYCIEGLVIDWKEEPLAGWQVVITKTVGYSETFTTAEDPDDPDEDIQEGEFETGDIQPGVYFAEVTLQDGWEGVTDTRIEIPLNKAGRDDCVTIRFKVRQIVRVTVLKINHEHEGLEDWNIKAIPGPGNLFAESTDEDTDINGQAVFTLTPGNWIFKEMQPMKDDDEEDLGPYAPVVPPNGVQTLDVKASEGPYTITFKNKIKEGCIRVVKNGVTSSDFFPENPPADVQAQAALSGIYGVAGWGFKLLLADGSVYRQGITDGRGVIDFERLPFGPYTIVEEDRAGWSETSYGFTEYDYTLTSEDPACGQNVVEFVNEQDGSAYCVEGRKIDVNGGYGIPGWEIKIKPLDEGGFDPANVFTDGLGEFRIEFPDDDYRIPGAEYEICEDDDVDGWEFASPQCQKVRLPKWPMGACIQLEDFVNQQVGHQEKVKQDEMHAQAMAMRAEKESEAKDDMGKPGMDMGMPGMDDRGGMDMGKPGMDDHGMDMGKPSMERGKMDECHKFHIVGKGEGLFDIGADYNVTPQAMLDANPDVRNSTHLWLYEGQEVCIP